MLEARRRNNTWKVKNLRFVVQMILCSETEGSVGSTELLFLQAGLCFNTSLDRKIWFLRKEQSERK